MHEDLLSRVMIISANQHGPPTPAPEFGQWRRVVTAEVVEQHSAQLICSLVSVMTVGLAQFCYNF